MGFPLERERRRKKEQNGRRKLCLPWKVGRWEKGDAYQGRTVLGPNNIISKTCWIKPEWRKRSNLFYTKDRMKKKT